MAEYVVFGLGRFGSQVARHLTRFGHSVLAVDRQQELVEAMASEVDAALCLDATDEQALAELQVGRIGCAVVAFGADSNEASILTTALLRQAGVARIVVRSTTALQARVLRAIGADEVINPEEAMGERLARRLALPNVLEQFDLGPGTRLAEIDVPEAWAGRSIRELDVRRKLRLTVLVVRRGDTIIEQGLGDLPLQSGDVIVVLGSDAAIGNVGALI